MALVPFPGPQAGPTRFRLTKTTTPSGGKMSFLEHLDELRKRIVNSAIAVGVGILVDFAFIERIFNFILAPTSRRCRRAAS